ncbi:MAG: TlpA disulfide reductase family protein [Planctomycetia bacterium]|nr:TlpA disulfide reductase family protein [Planctomycetia bacterium]
MSRILWSVLVSVSLVLLLSVSACEDPKVREVPGQTEALPDSASSSEDAGMDAEIKKLQEEILSQQTPEAQAKILKEVEKWTKLPEEKTLESVRPYLDSFQKMDDNTKMYFQLMPQDKQMTLIGDIIKCQEDAADFVLSAQGATDDDLKKAVSAKVMAFTFAGQNEKKDVTPEFVALKDVLKKLGKTDLLWETELMEVMYQVSQLDLRKAQSPEEVTDLQKKGDAFIETIFSLIKSGNEKGVLDEARLREIIGFVGMLCWQSGLTTEEMAEQWPEKFRVLLGGMTPTEKLTESVIQSAILEMEFHSLVTDFLALTSQMLQNNEETLPKAELDSILARGQDLLKRMAEKNALNGPQAEGFLRMIHIASSEQASGEKVIAMTEMLREAVKTSVDEQIKTQKELLVDKLTGVLRRLNLPGNKMELVAKNLDGTPFSLDNLSGKVVLVELCINADEPMRDTLPILKKAYSVFKDSGFEIVSYYLEQPSGEQPTEDVPTFLRNKTREQGINWTVVLKDPDAKRAADLEEYYGIMVVPAFFLIGADGKVVSVNLTADTLMAELKKLFPNVEVPEDPVPEFPSLDAESLNAPAETPEVPEAPAAESVSAETPEVPEAPAAESAPAETPEVPETPAAESAPAETPAE